jgi:tetratricopeptide (TPR) repeat protein
MRYVAGDLDTAVKRAEALADRPGASTLSQRLADFRQAKTAGDGAQIAGDMEQAIRSWEEALAIDAEIVPATDPSALRQEVGDRLAGELYRKGSAAFARGQYAEAYRQWSAGVRNNPANIDLLAGIAQLEELARTMLSNVPARGKLRRDGCSRLRDIKAMTLPESAVHQEAKSRRSSGGCRK